MFDTSKSRQEAWNNAESPLRDIDPVLKQFAEVHKINLTKNYHSHPERSLEWETGKVKRLMQLFLVDIKGSTFNFWLSAYKDENNERYAKDEFLAKNASKAEMSQQLSSWLVEGKRIIDSWDEKDLVKEA